MPPQSSPPTPRLGRLVLKIVGVIVALAGLSLFIGGVQLLSLGGSWYYAIAGAALIVIGALFFIARRLAIWIFTVLYLGTIIWALWEAGFEFWPLVPRLVAPTVLAIIVAVLSPIFPKKSGNNSRVPFAIAGILILGLIATGFSAFQPHGVIRNQFASKGKAEVLDTSSDWRHYGKTPHGTRYAAIDQINTSNVKDLEVAWTFRSGDIPIDPAQNQNTPLFIKDTLYTCSPHNIVHAINAETGEQRWKFDPQAKSPTYQRCRGVSYYETVAANEATTGTPVQCAARIVLTTIDARLIELDAKTGQPCADFGVNGTVDLKNGMGPVKDGYYFQTSAPTVMRDLIMVGGWVWDNLETGEPSGAVRAFSANTGELVWAWDLGNPAITKEPPEGQSYTAGTPNVWSTPSYDDKLGLVYLPTGNATPDFFGAQRSKEAEEHNSSIVALDIATGRERWKFQTVHHDIWDYDIPSQPALYDVPDGKGGSVPALVQVTKRGQIFMLDRRDGKPLAEVEERPVPQEGKSPEEYLSPTQPYSVGMPSIGTEPLTEARMWGATPWDQLYCRIEFKKMRYDGEFTPLGLKRAIINPGYFGGMNWGSASIDEANGLLIVNDIRMPQLVQLLTREITDTFKAQKSGHDGASVAPQRGLPYGALKSGFLSPLDVPCQQPPFGTISAIDLTSKQLVWQIPAGTLQDTGPLGMKTGMSIPVGMPTLGGPITTAGNLVFYAGTQDYYLRAFDVTNGNELWKGRLPVGAQATPMTYISPESGKQFVVISAGGARQSPDRGDYLIAYRLK